MKKKWSDLNRRTWITWNESRLFIQKLILKELSPGDFAGTWKVVAYMTVSWQCHCFFLLARVPKIVKVYIYTLTSQLDLVPFFFPIQFITNLSRNPIGLQLTWDLSSALQSISVQPVSEVVWHSSCLFWVEPWLRPRAPFCQFLNIFWSHDLTNKLMNYLEFTFFSCNLHVFADFFMPSKDGCPSCPICRWPRTVCETCASWPDCCKSVPVLSRSDRQKMIVLVPSLVPVFSIFL